MPTLLSTQAERAAGAISRAWFARNPSGWWRALELAESHGLSLLDLIDGVCRELRDEVARAAFDEQRGMGVEAWLRRLEIQANARAAGGGNQPGLAGIQVLTRVLPSMRCVKESDGREFGS